MSRANPAPPALPVGAPLHEIEGSWSGAVDTSLGSLGLLVLFASSAFAAPPARFVAKLADGTVVEGSELTEWQKADANPKLQGQTLLDPAKPLLWLQDRNLTPGDPPPAFVELFSGDRLPGSIVGYQREDSAAIEQAWAHWVVQPSAALRPPKPNAGMQLRVLAKFVRRIVWQRRATDRYQPGTLFCRDGKVFSFRVAKIADGSVMLLLPDGTRRVGFEEIAELHLPVGDSWDRYLDELALESPNLQSRLLQLETDDGLVATASTRHFAAFAFDGGKSSDGWAHGLQPAWSLDILWVPHSHVMVRRMFAPHELPLSRVAPLKTPPQALARSSGWPWQLNRNTRGGRLRSGGQEAGWGYGVHAYSELHFQLPPLARSFRTTVGLDRVVDKGGCVQVRVWAGAMTGTPLFQSPVMVGSETAVSTGNLPLPASAGKPVELVLQVDTAHTNRPPGADPFDIRDTADWLDPVVELDAKQLQEEVTRRVTWPIAAWKDWNLAGAATCTWLLQQREFPDRPGAFASCVVAQKEPLVLSRQLKLTADDRWLLLAVSQGRMRDKAPVLQVRINGELALEQAIPFRENPAVQINPLVLPLANYQHGEAGEARFEIRQPASTDDLPVDWRGIAWTKELPMLRPVFEDVGEFVFLDGEATTTATLVQDDRHSGRSAVQIASGGRFRLALSGPVSIRERPGWGEYRFLRFAFRKSGGGRVCLELDHANAAQRPTRLDAGQGEPSYGKAQRVQAGPLPDQWMVVTRDLYTDCGALDVTGIVLSAPDGQSARFDHIYVARTIDDFQYLPSSPSPELTNQKARETLAQPVLAKASPACVAIDFGGGRFGTGAILDAAGSVLTAGHLVLGPDKAVTVQLADGRSLAATTRGVCRDLDLGLVQLPSPGPYPFVEIDPALELPANELYLALVHKRPLVPGQAAIATVVDVRRMLRDSVWADPEIADWAAGGPLLNRNARLVAVHTRRSGFGGFLYSKLGNPAVFLPRLKNGEIWGAWQLSAGPLVGVVITTTAAGCLVKEVMPDMSAARQGLRAGDYFRKVNGRTVLTLDDVYAALAEKDPGQDVDVEYTRGQETRQTKIQLGLRSP